MHNDPYADPHERRMQAQSMVKTPERRNESDPKLRLMCVEMAVRASLLGTSHAELVAMAREFEQFIIGRPYQSPMKEQTS